MDRWGNIGGVRITWMQKYKYWERDERDCKREIGPWQGSTWSSWGSVGRREKKDEEHDGCLKHYICGFCCVDGHSLLQVMVKHGEEYVCMLL